MKLSLDPHELASCDAEDNLSPLKVDAKFRKEIQSHGLIPPEAIEPGKWTRGPGYGKGPRNDAASYLLFEDGKGDVIQDWSTDLKETWFVDQKPRSQSQIRIY